MNFTLSMLFSTFHFQAMMASFLPIVGPVVGLVHMCLLYSLYTFEYKWINMGKNNRHSLVRVPAYEANYELKILQSKVKFSCECSVFVYLKYSTKPTL